MCLEKLNSMNAAKQRQASHWYTKVSHQIMLSTGVLCIECAIFVQDLIDLL